MRQANLRRLANPAGVGPISADRGGLVPIIAVAALVVAIAGASLASEDKEATPAGVPWATTAEEPSSRERTTSSEEARSTPAPRRDKVAKLGGIEVPRSKLLGLTLDVLSDEHFDGLGLGYGPPARARQEVYITVRDYPRALRKEFKEHGARLRVRDHRGEIRMRYREDGINPSGGPDYSNDVIVPPVRRWVIYVELIGPHGVARLDRISIDVR